MRRSSPPKSVRDEGMRVSISNTQSKHGRRGVPNFPCFDLFFLPDSQPLTEEEAAAFLRQAKASLADARRRGVSTLDWLYLPGGGVRTNAGPVKRQLKSR